MRPLLTSAWLLTVLWGCAASNGYGAASSGSGLHRLTSAGGSPGASTGSSSGSVASTSGGSGSGSAGATGGTTGAAAVQSEVLPDGGCPPEGYRFTPTDCGPGLVEEIWNLVAVPGGGPVADTQVADITDLSRTAVSDACGYFHFCVDAGTRLAFSVSPAGFISELSPYIQLTSLNSQNVDAPGLSVVSQTNEMIAASIAGNFDATRAFIFAYIVDNEVQLAIGPCSDISGWTFSVATQDGGAVDAGVVYLSGLGASQLTSTDRSGVAFLYNIDPTLQTVVLSATPPARLLLPDGGVACVPVDAAYPYNMAGPTLPLRASFGSIAPYLISTPQGG